MVADFAMCIGKVAIALASAGLTFMYLARFVVGNRELGAYVALSTQNEATTNS